MVTVGRHPVICRSPWGWPSLPGSSPPQVTHRRCTRRSVTHVTRVGRSVTHVTRVRRSVTHVAVCGVSGHSVGWPPVGLWSVSAASRWVVGPSRTSRRQPLSRLPRGRGGTKYRHPASPPVSRYGLTLWRSSDSLKAAGSRGRRRADPLLSAPSLPLTYPLLPSPPLSLFSPRWASTLLYLA